MSPSRTRLILIANGILMTTGIEMRMPGRDKGDAVRKSWMKSARRLPSPYLGDDATDERAILALGTRGLSVLFRPEWGTTAAALRIRPPEVLWEFLTRWLQACREPHRRAGDRLLWL